MLTVFTVLASTHSSGGREIESRARNRRKKGERKKKEIERDGGEEGKITFHFFIDLQASTNIVLYRERKSI